MGYLPFKIQQLDQTTEEWTDYKGFHALEVNKATSDESFNSGAEQFHVRLWFKVRWCPGIEAVAYAPQLYRIVYKGRYFNIRDYDDFMEQHTVVKLLGEAYG